MNRNAIVDAWRGLSGASRAALGLAVAATVVVLWMAPSVFSALFAGSLQSVTKATGDNDANVLAYNESVKQDVKFVSERSPFFAPAGPPPKIVKRDLPPRPEGPTPPPRAYGGPKLVGLIGNSGALFERNVSGDKAVVFVGGRGGEVELVSIERPWKANVRWQGGEFELNLFDRLDATQPTNLGATPRPQQPTMNIFGGDGTTAATTGDLDFGAAAGDDSVDNN